MGNEAEDLLEVVRRDGLETTLHISHNAAGVRGLFASSPATFGRVLASTPSNLQLTMPHTDSAYASPWLLREVLYYRREQEKGGKASKQSKSRSSAARCVTCGRRLWRPSLPPEAVRALPRPCDLVTGYSWPQDALPLIACPSLERVVQHFQRRVQHVYATGLQHAQDASQAPPAPHKRDPELCLSLAEAEVQANGGCPMCVLYTHTTHPLPTAPDTQQGEQEHPDTVPSAEGADTQQGGVQGGGGGGGGDKEVVCGWRAAVRGGMCLATRDDVAWAASLVCSRTFATSFYRPPPSSHTHPATHFTHTNKIISSMVMIPFIDMINHDENPNAELTSCSDTDYDTRSHSSDSSLSNDECDVTHTTHSHSAHSVLSPAGRTPPRVPRRWAKGYNRRNILRSRRGIRAGDEVHFAYHEDLGFDEMLIYYGFLPAPPPSITPAPPPPHKPYNTRRSPSAQDTNPSTNPATKTHHARRCTVDCAGFTLPCCVTKDSDNSSSNDIGSSDWEWRDEKGNVQTDPFSGPWKESGVGGEASEAELRRLVERLSDVHSRISHLQTAPDVLQAAERACHDAGLDWLPPVVDEMRRRRVAALEAQIARTRELLSAGAGVTQTHVSQTPASALEVQG